MQEPQKPQSIQDMLNAQFTQRGAPQPRVQPPPVEVVIITFCINLV